MQFLKTILSLFNSLRNVLFIALFLFSGTLHQAVEKQSDSRAEEKNMEFIHKTVTTINPEYALLMERKLDSLLKRRGFNGSVMLAHQGQQVYNRSFGYARFSNKKEFSEENNIFQLASVGKQFTAIATLMLFEDGLIGLDDKVVNYIEDFPYPDITIRNLLNHTSGLQNYFYVIDNYWDKDYIPTHDDMLKMIIKHDLPLNFTPGRRFSYSNTGYAFLAMIIERVSGRSFASYIHENIFSPLDMRNSFVYSPTMDMSIFDQPNMTYGYERAGRWLREIPIDYLDGITGDKGIYSCTEDLLKWDNALENNHLISESAMAMAFESGVLRSGYRTNYGFGFRIRKGKDDENIIYHHGWWRGYRTAYVRLPENTLLVILNNNTASINGLDNQIRKLIEQSNVSPVKEERMLTYLSGRVENN